MNLCTAYIFLLLSYAVGVTRTESEAGCKAGAAILQYFLLCVFMWSAVEGLNSFRGLVMPMAEEIRKFMWKAMFIAWGKWELLNFLDVFLSQLSPDLYNFGSHRPSNNTQLVENCKIRHT